MMCIGEHRVCRKGIGRHLKEGVLMSEIIGPAQGARAHLPEMTLLAGISSLLIFLEAFS